MKMKIRGQKSGVSSQQSELTEQQRALLTLVNSAGIDGITAEGLLLAAKSAGFDDLTLDDVRGPAGLQSLALRGLVFFRAVDTGGRWHILRKGKEVLG